MIDQELPGDIYPELVAANAELSRACETLAHDRETWRRRADELERDLIESRARAYELGNLLTSARQAHSAVAEDVRAARTLLEEQARMIDGLTTERDALAAARLEDATSVAKAERAREQAEQERDQSLLVATDSARECARLRNLAARAVRRLGEVVQERNELTAEVARLTAELDEVYSRRELE